MNEPKIRFKGFCGEWNASRLGEFSTSFSGGTPVVGVSDYYGGNIPFIRSGEIQEDKTELFITEAGLNSSSAKIVDKGTGHLQKCVVDPLFVHTALKTGACL